jgi:hypothetical protein
MSTFSFTAPSISPEELQAEREALPPEERQKIHNDLFGKEQSELDEFADAGISPALMESLTVMMQDALDSGIPDQEKEAYLEAVALAPDVVTKESSAQMFLRYTNYDPWAAARGLISYWEMRKEIFGADRAFLPMTMSGAMAENREHLDKAIVILLGSDRHARPVVLFDRIRSSKRYVQRNSVLRCVFYVLHCICMMEEGLQNGFVVLTDVRVRFAETACIVRSFCAPYPTAMPLLCIPLIKSVFRRRCLGF